MYSMNTIHVLKYLFTCLRSDFIINSYTQQLVPTFFHSQDKLVINGFFVFSRKNKQNFCYLGILLTPILNEINIDCIPHIFSLLVKKHKMFWVKKELKCYTIVIYLLGKKLLTQKLSSSYKYTLEFVECIYFQCLV